MKNRIGEVSKNTLGIEMIILKYINWNEVLVEFKDEYNATKITTYRQFKNGEVKNPYEKSVYKVGMIGIGDYNDTNTKSKRYRTWHHMIGRCYDNKRHIEQPTYKDCVVCDEWHIYQNFAQWYDENYYEVDGMKTELDKDILVKGNKIYSRDTCCFVLRQINMLFVKSNSTRG